MWETTTSLQLSSDKDLTRTMGEWKGRRRQKDFVTFWLPQVTERSEKILQGDVEDSVDNSLQKENRSFKKENDAFGMCCI